MHQTTRDRRDQRGNILFLILLAVALFAALNYAVTSSMRGGGNDTNTERSMITVSAYLQSLLNLRNTITRLQLVVGCRDDQFDFSGMHAANANAPADKRCHIFDPAGGNLTIPPNLPGSSNSIVVLQMLNTGTSGASGTTSANDLVVRINTPSKGDCEALNKALDVDMAVSENVNVVGVSGGAYGSYTNGSFVGPALISNNQYVGGKVGFCRQGSMGVYQGFYTLLAR